MAWTRRAAERAFSWSVIQQAVWLYFRFALSYRDVEDMLAERGIDVSYETVRRWAFGTIIARKLRRGRPRPDGRWHLDEVFVSVNGKQLYVWRAVDSEGEVLDILVQPRRDRQAAYRPRPPPPGRRPAGHRTPRGDAWRDRSASRFFQLRRTGRDNNASDIFVAVFDCRGATIRTIP